MENAREWGQYLDLKKWVTKKRGKKYRGCELCQREQKITTKDGQIYGQSRDGGGGGTGSKTQGAPVRQAN